MIVGKKISVGYSKEKEMLVISEPMESFVPAYLYYLCQSMELQNNITIKYVYFTKTNEQVLVSALKGVENWDDLYEDRSA